MKLLSTILLAIFLVSCGEKTVETPTETTPSTTATTITGTTVNGAFAPYYQDSDVTIDSVAYRFVASGSWSWEFKVYASAVTANFDKLIVKREGSSATLIGGFNTIKVGVNIGYHHLQSNYVQDNYYFQIIKKDGSKKDTKAFYTK